MDIGHPPTLPYRPYSHTLYNVQNLKALRIHNMFNKLRYCRPRWPPSLIDGYYINNAFIVRLKRNVYSEVLIRL